MYICTNRYIPISHCKTHLPTRRFPHHDGCKNLSPSPTSPGVFLTKTQRVGNSTAFIQLYNPPEKMNQKPEVGAPRTCTWALKNMLETPSVFRFQSFNSGYRFVGSLRCPRLQINKLDSLKCQSLFSGTNMWTDRRQTIDIYLRIGFGSCTKMRPTCCDKCGSTIISANFVCICCGLYLTRVHHP